MSRAPILLLSGLLLAVLPARGQESPTPNVIQFSFSNPGARSLALGGAFAALADDATAAFANPAGLIQLTQPEVSIEGKIRRYSSPYTRGGRVSGPPTGIGLDTVQGLQLARSETDLASLSFLSYVHPGPRWSLAFYRHQLSDFESAGETQGLFALDLPGFPGQSRFNDLRQSSSLKAVSHGVAGAWQVNEALSLGLGLVLTEAEFTSVSEGFDPTPGPAGFFAENPFSPALLSGRETLSLDDRDLTLAGGLLWRPSPRWNLASFYRGGAEAALQIVLEAGPSFDAAIPAGTIVADVRTPIHLPDVFGLGLAFKSRGGALTVGFEWDRVEYSDIVDSLDPETTEAEFLALADGNELHLGFEYVFLRASPLLALRAGGWLDPDHQIRSLGTEPFERALLRGSDDELHLTVGLGLAFADFQIDLGADFSALVDTATLSAIYSF